MAWDDTKTTGSSLSASEWNAHVTDQKIHKTRHDSGGTDELTHLTNSTGCHNIAGSNIIAGAGTGDITLYTGTIPTSITEVDISSYTGARSSLIFLKLTGDYTSTSDVRVYFRGKNMSFPTADSTDNNAGAACMFHKAVPTYGDICFPVLITDSGGIFEWYNSLITAVNNVTLKLIAWINLS